MFRDNLSVPSLKVKLSKKMLECLNLEDRKEKLSRNIGK